MGIRRHSRRHLLRRRNRAGAWRCDGPPWPIVAPGCCPFGVRGEPRGRSTMVSPRPTRGTPRAGSSASMANPSHPSESLDYALRNDFRSWLSIHLWPAQRIASDSGGVWIPSPSVLMAKHRGRRTLGDVLFRIRMGAQRGAHSHIPRPRPMGWDGDRWSCSDRPLRDRIPVPAPQSPGDIVRLSLTNCSLYFEAL